ncbi:MAG: Rpn family recombination-promoting nuclease/putative transposase [Bacteroidales bacterium]|nr:Rpn family recombination-promoting nuclease/putative transposase [Bacteroidales bacterium]
MSSVQYYIVVEMQKSRQQFPIDRGMAYASRLISKITGLTEKEIKP